MTSTPYHAVRPREFPSSGFVEIRLAQKIEEESLPSYNRNEYYPMRIGDVVRGRYQVVAKLGYGSSSTVWLARDLTIGKYWTLKVHINTLQHNQELSVYQHLAGIKEDEEGMPGREYVRQLERSFKIKGPHGEHDVFVMTPLGMSLRTFQEIQKDGAFQRDLVTSAINQVLLGLNYLHNAEVTHTDLHSDNLLISLTEDSVLKKVEESEIHKPSARKRVGDTIIHVSHYLLGGAGPLMICDLGQARIGKAHSGNAMPVPYRTPEVILDMSWGSSVDTWSVGLLAWELLEGKNLFQVYDQESSDLNDAHHLAAMTVLLGPPPLELLKRSEKSSNYWDENSEWKGPVSLPPKQTLESLETKLMGEDKELFLNLIRNLLSWLPEERPPLLHAFFHKWLRGESS